MRFHDKIAEYATVPNVMQLCQQPRVCLTESEEVPQDWTTLFQTKRNKIIRSRLLKEIHNQILQFSTWIRIWCRRYWNHTSKSVSSTRL